MEVSKSLGVQLLTQHFHTSHTHPNRREYNPVLCLEMRLGCKNKGTVGSPEVLPQTGGPGVRRYIKTRSGLPAGAENDDARER